MSYNHPSARVRAENRLLCAALDQPAFRVAVAQPLRVAQPLQVVDHPLVCLCGFVSAAATAAAVLTAADLIVSFVLLWLSRLELDSLLLRALELQQDEPRHSIVSAVHTVRSFAVVPGPKSLDALGALQQSTRCWSCC